MTRRPPRRGLRLDRAEASAAGVVERVRRPARGRPANQKPGCQLSYEIEFRIAWQAPPGQDRLRYVTVLFDAASDLKPADRRLAVFGIPVGRPVSPARALLVQGLSLYEDVRWRLSAVNGAQAASPWSAMRRQGPAAAGVDG